MAAPAAAAAVAGAISGGMSLTGGIVEAVSGKRRQQRAISAQEQSEEKKRGFDIKGLVIGSKRDLAEADQIEKFVLEIEDLLQKGDIDTAEALTRIQTMTAASSGKMKRIIESSVEQGMEQIQTQHQDALKRLQANLVSAREDVNASEQKEIDRALKEVKQLRRAHDEDTKAIKETMVRRGIVGAPLAAMIAKNTERLGDAVSKVHEASGNITGELGRQLGKINAQGLLEQAILDSKKMAEMRALQGQAGIEAAKQELAISERGFEQAEQRREIGRQERIAGTVEKGKLGIEAAATKAGAEATQAAFIGAAPGKASPLKEKKLKLISELGEEAGRAEFERQLIEGQMSDAELARKAKKESLVAKFGREKGLKQFKKRLQAGEI